MSPAVLRITGKMRKRIILDLSASIGLGSAAAFAYWYVPPCEARVGNIETDISLAGTVSVSLQVCLWPNGLQHTSVDLL